MFKDFKKENSRYGNDYVVTLWAPILLVMMYIVFNLEDVDLNKTKMISTHIDPDARDVEDLDGVLVVPRLVPERQLHELHIMHKM